VRSLYILRLLSRCDRIILECMDTGDLSAGTRCSETCWVHFCINLYALSEVGAIRCSSAGVVIVLHAVTDRADIHQNKKPRCRREDRAMPLTVHFDTCRILQRHRAVSLPQ